MGAFSINDALELLIFWAGIYWILRSLRGTRGLGILKGGVGFLLGLYLFSKLLMPYLNVSLDRVTYLLESLATAALIAFVIIFQPEVRRGLTRLGENPLSLFTGRGEGQGASIQAVQPIAEAAGRMSRRRIGALIVIERSIGTGSVTETGVPLNADVSSPLLESIFYPNTPLHDGAVVVRDGVMVAASCVLPLSDRTDLGPEVGTRHRAAVGLTEESDAVVVVVSEQTGRISVAFRGSLQAMRDQRELESTLNRILSGEIPEWAAQARVKLPRSEPAEPERIEPEAGAAAVKVVGEDEARSRRSGARAKGDPRPAEEPKAGGASAAEDRAAEAGA